MFVYRIYKFKSFISNNELQRLPQLCSLDKNHAWTHSIQSQIVSCTARTIQHQLQKLEEYLCSNFHMTWAMKKQQRHMLKCSGNGYFLITPCHCIAKFCFIFFLMSASYLTVNPGGLGLYL